MTAAHPLFSELGALRLFNTFTGVGLCERITAGVEQKHGCKRLKERIKSGTPTVIGNIKLTGYILKRLLKALGTSSISIKKWFATGFRDSMRVAPMIELFYALADLPKHQPAEFGDQRVTYTRCLPALKILGAVCEHLLIVVHEHEHSLQAKMVSVSVLMHLLLVAFRKHGTKFIAAQTYLNVQRMLRSLYWSVANCKKEGIKRYFPFLDAGDGLEIYFSVLRCCLAGESFDLLQYLERSEAVETTCEIFESRPGWYRGAKHLKNSKDHMNTKTYLRIQDGSVDKDYSRVDVQGVSLLNALAKGARTATAVLEDAGNFAVAEYDWDVLNELDIDFLRPHGKFVGVTVEKAPELAPLEPGQAGRAADAIDQAAASVTGILGEAMLRTTQTTLTADHSFPNGYDAAGRTPRVPHTVPPRPQLRQTVLGGDSLRAHTAAAEHAVVDAAQDAMLVAPAADDDDAEDTADREMERDFEDVFNGADDSEASTYAKHILDVPGYEGKPMPLQFALRLATQGHTQRAEPSRISRYMGKLKSGTALKDELVLADGEKVVFAQQDIAVALAHTGLGVTLMVILCESFSLEQGKPRANVTINEYRSKGAVVTGQILNMVAANGGLKLACEIKASAPSGV